jgi:hypothetical protein
MNSSEEDFHDPSARNDELQRRAAEDAWLDQALDETFPASDPVPWYRGDGGRTGANALAEDLRSASHEEPAE